MGWEGVDAKRRGVGLNAFLLEDFNIPYGYSPVLVATQDTLKCVPCCAILRRAMTCCAWLCYARLVCAVLCCAVLCCAVLCCAVLRCAALRCAVLCCVVL